MTDREKFESEIQKGIACKERLFGLVCKAVPDTSPLGINELKDIAAELYDRRAELLEVLK